MNRCLVLLLLITGGMTLTFTGAPAAGEKAAGDKQGPLLVTYPDGKERQVKNWKFAHGSKNVLGAECLEFFEGKFAPLKKSVLAYIPISSIRSIQFEVAKDKETVTVRVAHSDKEADDEMLVGPTGYVDTNIVTIDAADDAGGPVKGGVKDGARLIRFPAPKPAEALPKGRAATVKNVNDKYPTLKVVGLEVLYIQGNGEWKTLPTLYFSDPSKFDLGDMAKLTQMRSGGNNYQVTLLTGKKSPRVLVTEPKLANGPDDLELVGFIGRFSAGYRVFPIITVGEVLFEDMAKK